MRRIRGDDPGPLLDDAERIMGNRPDDMMLVGYARLGAGQPCAALRIARKALAEHPAFEAAKKLLAETSGKCKTDTER